MARVCVAIGTLALILSVHGSAIAESPRTGYKADKYAARERARAAKSIQPPTHDPSPLHGLAAMVAPPANDDCANAEVITTFNYDSSPVAVAEATIEECEVMDSCLEFQVGVSNSIWYRFTAPSPGLIDVSTSATDGDTVLSIWDGCASGPPCDEPAQLACNDDDGEFLTSRIDDFQVSAGTTYWIKISDFDTDPIPEGDFELHFSFQADAPIAQIDSPMDFACACLNNAVLGTATAAGGFHSWRLEYQPTGAALWTPFATGETPLIDQQLGNWNTGALSEEHYFLRLVAANQAGASDSDVVVVYADKQFATAEIAKPAAGGVVGGLACIEGAAFDEHCFDHYTVNFRQTGGTFAPVNPGQPEYDAQVHSGTLVPGGWNTIGKPDGSYELRLTGRTACNNTATDAVTMVIDNTPPVALITEPAACESFSGHVHVMGTATDANLTRWELQYTGGDAVDWVTIASGTTPRNNAMLTMWDVSQLPACSYTLRLLVEDAAEVDCRGPHVSEYLVSIEVGDICPLDLDGDGDQDLSDFSTFQNCQTGPLP